MSVEKKNPPPEENYNPIGFISSSFIFEILAKMSLPSLTSLSFSILLLQILYKHINSGYDL